MRYNFIVATISLIFVAQIATDAPSINIVNLDQYNWRLYRDLRLNAVLECPHAFGSTYEEELAVTPEDWQRRLNFNMLFAQKDGDIVGMIGAVIDGREKTKHTALIISFYVHESARNNGIGSLLLSKMLENLQNNPGIKKISLQVTTTQNAVVQLYKKFGFNITGTSEQEYCINDDYYDQYIMTKWQNSLFANHRLNNRARMRNQVKILY
jgi:ribosomal protein S18 acetylase RimI-like enzyme